MVSAPDGVGVAAGAAHEINAASAQASKRAARCSDFGALRTGGVINRTPSGALFGGIGHEPDARKSRLAGRGHDLGQRLVLGGLVGAQVQFGLRGQFGS